MIQLLLAVIYLAFISLGLPDSLLGAAWPVMYDALHVPVSYAGLISMIIAAGTVVSSLMSDRLVHRLGAGKVTALSVGLTALALFGFSVSHSFGALCLWAVPYGLGAGSVDAALNTYVALHYASRHMSWLHCMWGIGATLGPSIMGAALAGGLGWNGGYRIVALIQIGLSVILIVSLPLWKQEKRDTAGTDQGTGSALTLKETIRLPGVRSIMISFFCYCGLEQTTGLWGSSYLVLHGGLSAADAARLASLFFLGITAGRALSGFLTMALSDDRMIRLGQALILTGIAVLIMPWYGLSQAGLLLIGLGCAPIYPCMIHATPVRFGADRSQAVVGIQMASAYVGTCLLPPLFGLLAQAIGIAWLPGFQLVLLLAMMVLSARSAPGQQPEGR